MSFTNGLYRKLAGVFCISLLINTYSCDSCCRIPIEIDEQKIQQFHGSNQEPAPEISNNISLFVDYSTCFAEAVRSSDFFRQIRPRITGLNLTLYGIKGINIDTISNRSDIINEELNNVYEVDFANIPLACETICNNNDQAFLITDGEYWTQGIGERTDLAYLKNPFVKWISKGFDIYLFIEDYEENYHGKLCPKKRFYFLFTDDRLGNNIFVEISKAFRSLPLSDTLILLKISNTDIRLFNDFSVNQNLDSEILTDRGFSAFEILNEWDDLDIFVLNALDENNGMPVPGGDYLIRGLIMTSDPVSAYDYKELDIKVYNISEKYLNNEKIDFADDEVNDVFILDQELYARTGEIGIKISNGYYKSLYEKIGNLLRIDIIAVKTDKKLDRNNLEWGSLSKAGEINISIYQSILQTIDNPEIDPATNNQVLYSVYLKTTCL